MKNSKYFNISDIDIDRIRVSKGKLFRKEGKSYKHYIFYEDGDKRIPLNICFNNTLLGYYNEYINKDKNNKEYTSKTTNFLVDDNDLAYKIIHIFWINYVLEVKKETAYYTQILKEQCGYKIFTE